MMKQGVTTGDGGQTARSFFGRAITLIGLALGLQSAAFAADDPPVPPAAPTSLLTNLATAQALAGPAFQNLIISDSLGSINGINTRMIDPANPHNDNTTEGLSFASETWEVEDGEWTAVFNE